MIDNQGFTYLGTSIKHPISLFVGGRPQFEIGQGAVEQAILHRLNTPIGSLIFARDYGSNIFKLFFHRNDVVLRALLKEYIREALSNEERIVFLDCLIETQGEGCICNIQYRFKERSEVNSLVFPFYRN